MLNVDKIRMENFIMNFMDKETFILGKLGNFFPRLLAEIVFGWCSKTNM